MAHMPIKLPIFCFRLSFSLKIIEDNIKVIIKLPVFDTGKCMTEGIFPDKEKFITLLQKAIIPKNNAQ